MLKSSREKLKEKLPDTGCRAAKETRSANEGMKLSSHPTDGVFSAHPREFAVCVCKSASLGA